MLILHSLQPLQDTSRPDFLRALCQQADTVIALTGWRDEQLEQLADIMLPVADNLETGGTLVNLDGLSQSFNAAASISGNARPGWKIARMLADAVLADDSAAAEQQHDLLQWTDSESVRAAVAARLDVLRDKDGSDLKSAIHIAPEKPASMAAAKPAGGKQLYRLSELPMVRVDQLCRHSAALQATVHQVAERQARVHPDDLRKLDLADQGRALITQGEQQAEARVVADASIAIGTICIP